MSADLKQLENKLSSLGVSALVDYLGEEKSKKLNDLGIEVTAGNLAKFIADESGMEVFKDPVFRLEFLTTLAKDALNNLLPGVATNSETLLAWNDFRWGSNKKSRLFLDAIGMDWAPAQQPGPRS